MNFREPVYDVRASSTILFLKNNFGKVRKLQKIENLKNYHRGKIRAYKSAFLQEIIPLLVTGKARLSHTEM